MRVNTMNEYIAARTEEQAIKKGLAGVQGASPEQLDRLEQLSIRIYEYEQQHRGEKHG